VVETGDFHPTGSIWDKTRMRRYKLVAKTISEDEDADVLHYADSTESDTAVTRTDISFTATDTIATTAGNFRTSGIRQQQEVTVSGTTNNNLAFTVDSVSSDGKTLTVSGNSVTTEGAGASVTVTVTADMVIPLDSGSNRLTRTTKPLNVEAWCHRFKTTVATGSTTKGFQPIGWAYQAEFTHKDE